MNFIDTIIRMLEARLLRKLDRYVAATQGALRPAPNPARMKATVLVSAVLAGSALMATHAQAHSRAHE